MKPFQSQIQISSDEVQEQRQAMLTLVDTLRNLEQKASDKSEQTFAKRKQWGRLSPRQRVSYLIDADQPFLPLATIAGYGLDDKNLERCIPGGSQVAGIGFIQGVRCMIVATDSGIEAGALTEAGNLKLMRCQELALENRIPFVHLVESAGANLRKFRIDKFVRGGRIFYNLARLSAAGVPVITVVHGSSTAGGAYMPGLSDYVVMVQNHAKAFLAGPPLLKAATGEVADAQELGGSQMHATTSGLAEHLAQNDTEALDIVKDIVISLNWQQSQNLSQNQTLAPLYDPDELAGVMVMNHKKPIDMREVIARLTDQSHWLDFKANYGPETLCGHGPIDGQIIGFISNNGPIDPAGATKAAQFIQLCNQSNTPIIFLQNTTGFIVGKESEQAGMIKHGSKMIQALSNSQVPHITIMCGASFGAGNYGMCGLGFEPQFCFSWPNAVTAVMGGEQAATTIDIVVREKLARLNKPVDEAALQEQKNTIIENFDAQSSAFYTSGHLLDDGVIDPRHTRDVLVFLLKTIKEAEQRKLHPIQFGVARF